MKVVNIVFINFSKRIIFWNIMVLNIGPKICNKESVLFQLEYD
jgi:hypothetical protein